MYCRIELYLEKGECDYDGTIQTEDRYIVVDSEGMDCVGEHMTKEEAIEFINKI